LNAVLKLDRVVGSLDSTVAGGDARLPDFLNSASARVGVILECSLDIVADVLLFLSCDFQGFGRFFRSRQGSVGKLQPTGGIGRKLGFLFFPLASGLRHLEQIGQGGGNLARRFRMFGIIQKLHDFFVYGRKGITSR